MTSILVASVHDSLQALNRVVSLLRGRNFHIHSVAMTRSESANVSRLTVVMDGSHSRPERIVSTLAKLEEVWGVKEAPASDLVRRQAALVKVVDSESTRQWIAALPERSSTRLAARSGGACILELFGTPQDVEETIASLPAGAVIECARPAEFVMQYGLDPTTVIANEASPWR